MKKRKGDVAVEPLVVLGLIIATLALAGFGYYLQASDKIDFFEYLPGFEHTPGVKESVEIISYNFYEDSVEYYDGVKWNLLKKGEKVDLGDKRIRFEEAKKEFQDYFTNDIEGARNEYEKLSKRLSGQIERLYDETGDFGDLSKVKLEEVRPNRFLASSIALKEKYRIDGHDIGGGHVVMSLIVGNAIDQEICGKYFVGVKGNIFFEERDIEIEESELNCKSIDPVSHYARTKEKTKKDIGSDYDYLVGFASEWRDLVYKNPIRFTYYEVMGTKEKPIPGKYCVKKFTDRFVIMLDNSDLSGCSMKASSSPNSYKGQFGCCLFQSGTSIRCYDEVEEDQCSGSFNLGKKCSEDQCV